jgi:hypothetical protein
MPTISECQLLIEAILLAGEKDTDQRHRAEPTAIDQSGEEDEENMRQHMADILQAVMETRVLNPYEVPKCLQLYLVLA